MTVHAESWRKSTYSQQQTSCVEVGRIVGGAAVRDTKDRGAGYITVGTAQWSNFLASLKSGTFDR
ncbi:DUF397 domain-containing protein [Salinifilum ghardaiensis]